MNKPNKETWIAEQNELKKKLVFDDYIPQNISYIGGVDISFYKNDPNKAVSSYVILDSGMNVIYEDFEIVTLTVEYIPGFLSFREAPHLVKLIEKANIKADVILVDGCGYLHPRKFGLASHLSVLTNIPCIGIAKKFLVVDDIGLGQKEIRSLTNKKCLKAGDYLDIIGESGTRYGVSFICKDQPSNPVYISVGNKTNLDRAINIVKNCSIHRVPEPIRQADLRSREFIRKNSIT